MAGEKKHPTNQNMLLKKKKNKAEAYWLGYFSLLKITSARQHVVTSFVTYIVREMRLNLK